MDLALEEEDADEHALVIKLLHFLDKGSKKFEGLGVLKIN